MQWNDPRCKIALNIQVSRIQFPFQKSIFRFPIEFWSKIDSKISPNIRCIRTPKIPFQKNRFLKTPIYILYFQVIDPSPKISPVQRKCFLIPKSPFHIPLLNQSKSNPVPLILKDFSLPILIHLCKKLYENLREGK